MDKRTYYSSWDDFLRSSSAVGFALVFGYFLNGYSTIYAYGVLVCLVLELYLLWSHYSIHVDILENRWLVNSGQGLFSGHKVDLFNVTYIGRAQQYIWKSKESRLIVFGLERGQLKQTAFQEFHYDMATIRALLKDVLDINPKIGLDDQYRELIANPKNDPNKLKSTPSLRTVAQVEAYVSEHFSSL